MDDPPPDPYLKRLEKYRVDLATAIKPAADDLLTYNDLPPEGPFPQVVIDLIRIVTAFRAENAP